ncbi:ATP-dependent helicase [Arenibacter sp. TNZ]|jgi:ATP-dependent RNA helicase RhlE|uniref:DEAD/DEAH box helicase n=1 Tax=Arenibacter TaxID=178469 RepID=UPI000CD3DDAB|nr:MULTISPECIES: DEAD/DEAH box helicase [Arenibacter]MCM4171416.1 ATP-dependent helicase [Arenibacter sp. TNZ]
MTFKDLGIIEPILKALTAEGYTNPTPIQEQSIPILLKGKDLLGCAQTGTGKTAAFSIPIIQQMAMDREANQQQRKIRTLVVTPTRELAIQIGESFTSYSRFTGIRNTVIFGGIKQGRQTDALRKGVDVVIATPGRLLDLMNQGFISLRDVKYAVLDEADQMLDMGFIHDIKKIIAKLPSNRQSLFFSATMPPAIVELSKKILGDFDRVTIKPQQATAEKVEQGVYFVTKKNKPNLLIHLLEKDPNDSALVFSRTKHGANKIVKQLAKADIKADAIHGNKSQNARQKALGDFKDGELKVLIATDIAARGIDVEELSLVINYDLPNVPETYVHRIGRTGRASASGVALSFCDAEERPYLKDIQKLINQQVPVIKDHPFVDDGSEEVPLEEKKHHNNRQKPRTGHTNSRGGRTNNQNRSRNNRPKRD